MKDLCLKTYDIYSEKIKARGVRLHFLSDLHGLSFGANQKILMDMIKKRAPHLILIGGDMIVGSHRHSWKELEKLLKRLKQEVPVYYALGNHEQKVCCFGDMGMLSETGEFFEMLRENTMLLDNSSSVCFVRENRLRITGLSLEKAYYRKPFPKKLKVPHLLELLQEEKKYSDYEILLAHNPYHADTYFQWGSDLILCGHYHGGIVRFGENRGLLSTHFHLFPKYCCGRFQNGSQHLIVSPGMGEHSVKVRIHNPRELIEVNLLPKSK